MVRLKKVYLYTTIDIVVEKESEQVFKVYSKPTQGFGAVSYLSADFYSKSSAKSYFRKLIKERCFLNKFLKRKKQFRINFK